MHCVTALEKHLMQGNVVLENLHQAFVTAVPQCTKYGNKFPLSIIWQSWDYWVEKKPWISGNKLMRWMALIFLWTILNLLILEMHAIIHKINCLYLIIVFANSLPNKLKGERAECLGLWFSVVHAYIALLFTLIYIPSVKMLHFQFAPVPGAKPDCAISATWE